MSPRDYSDLLSYSFLLAASTREGEWDSKWCLLHAAAAVIHRQTLAVNSCLNLGVLNATLSHSQSEVRKKNNPAHVQRQMGSRITLGLRFNHPHKK